MKIIPQCFAMSILLMLALTTDAQQRRSGPPKEAFSACQHKAIGARCTVKTRRGTLTGACRDIPRFNQLICAPEGGRPNKGGDERARQFNQGPGTARKHTTVQSAGVVSKEPATQDSGHSPQVEISEADNERIIQANGIPEHLIGHFPNRGNPHGISPQQYDFLVPLNPELNNTPTNLAMNDFGVGVNGVPFDPNAAEWYQGNRGSEWRYEALSGAIKLGLDENNAHIQRTGAYHYHGFPTGLMKTLGYVAGKHSPLIGWAADGFPIYVKYGYLNKGDSKAVEMTSSYQLKVGLRPQPPGGKHDGTFVADYQYIAGSGKLDECNGRFVYTPDFPEGSYGYFLSTTFPVIPRCLKGKPSASFSKHTTRNE